MAKKQLTIWDAGNKVRNEILEKDISFTQLANWTKVPRSTLYELCYHGRDISSARLARICVAVGLSMDYVMGLTNTKNGGNDAGIQGYFR